MNEPPRTPQELESISRTLQTSGKVPYGYVWQGRQYEGLSCVFLEMIDGSVESGTSHKRVPLSRSTCRDRCCNMAYI